MRVKKKILHLITVSKWGGAQQVCYDIVTNLDESKYLVDVACAPGGELVDRLRERGLVVHTINSLKRDISHLNDLKALFTLYRLITTGRYDIVHCHGTKAGLLGSMVAFLARTSKIYFTVHSWGFYNVKEYGHMQRLLIFFEKISALMSDRIICVSESVKRDGLERKIAPRGKFTIIRNGTAWDYSSQGGYLRKEIEADETDILFGMVARLAYPKNPLLFLEAAKKVVAKYKSAKFVLIGDGSLYNDCESYVRENVLESQVFILGFRDARKLLQDLDAFVLTSHFEGLPMAIIEAMFAGLPIIATDVGGIRELVQDDQNGSLIDPSSIDELAEKMIYLIEHSDKRAVMGVESRKIAKESFTLDRMVREYEKLYLKL